MTAGPLAPDDPAVIALIAAIGNGDVEAVASLVDAQPELARARIGDDATSREVLHVVTDHPGHVPRCAESVAVLVAAGADPNARFAGPHRETPLHWAASSDDVVAVDALVAAGADIEADGGVLTGGPPLDDAVVFGQWAAARRLVDHGATTQLFHAAALGLDARVAELLAGDVASDEVTNALWHACNAGQATTARLLLAAGGDAHWVGWNGWTPAEAARRAGDAELRALLGGATPPA